LLNHTKNMQYTLNFTKNRNSFINW
jgi:hypothetical protein